MYTYVRVCVRVCACVSVRVLACVCIRPVSNSAIQCIYQSYSHTHIHTHTHIYTRMRNSIHTVRTYPQGVALLLSRQSCTRHSCRLPEPLKWILRSSAVLGAAGLLVWGLLVHCCIVCTCVCVCVFVCLVGGEGR